MQCVNWFLCLINFLVIYWGPQSYLKRHGGPRTKMSWEARCRYSDENYCCCTFISEKSPSKLTIDFALFMTHITHEHVATGPQAVSPSLSHWVSVAVTRWRSGCTHCAGDEEGVVDRNPFFVLLCHVIVRLNGSARQLLSATENSYVS